METVYIIIWHEAIEVEDLVEGVYLSLTEAHIRCDKLNAEASGYYWEVIEKQITR